LDRLLALPTLDSNRKASRDTHSSILRTLNYNRKSCITLALGDRKTVASRRKDKNDRKKFVECFVNTSPDIFVQVFLGQTVTALIPPFVFSFVGRRDGGRIKRGFGG